jgi:hypothetical protein
MGVVENVESRKYEELHLMILRFETCRETGDQKQGKK